MPRARGFTLIEVLVVLLIFGVLIAMAAVITRAVTAAQKRSLTATRIATVETALAQFVLQQKRLPCPADGRKASNVNDAGLEERTNGGLCKVTGVDNTQQHGVVPWRTLALTETDATDGWDRRLTYRVEASLVLPTTSGGMDMSWCDPASTLAPVVPAAICSTNCSSSSLATCTSPAGFLMNKGLEVRNVGGEVLMNPAATPHTGAAYVVISHGETGGGAYAGGGYLVPSTTTDGTEEARNYANVAFTGAGTSYYFVDGAINENPGNSHFDDVVLRPSILSVVAKAGLAARSH